MEEELRKQQEQDEEQGEYGSEERVSALPEGRAGGRRGETARQLIRRAKQASRRPRQIKHIEATSLRTGDYRDVRKMKCSENSGEVTARIC